VEKLSGLDVRVAFCLDEMSKKAECDKSEYHTVIKMPLPAIESFQYWLVAKVLKVASELSAGVKKGALGQYFFLNHQYPFQIDPNLVNLLAAWNQQALPSVSHMTCLGEDDH